MAVAEPSRTEYLRYGGQVEQHRRRKGDSLLSSVTLAQH